MDNNVEEKKYDFNDKNKLFIAYDSETGFYVTKGIHVMLYAWKKIKDTRLIICGTGPEEQWCRDFVKENGLENVIIKGFVEHDQTMNIIAESKALILPTQWYEGFPMVLTESFVCGTPVIGSRIGNVGSIVTDRVNGLHIDQTSQDDIVRAVSELNDMTESTKDTAVRLYNAENNYRQLMAIYQNIMTVKDQ